MAKNKKVATKAQRRKSIREVLTGQPTDEFALKREVLRAVDVACDAFAEHKINPIAGVAALQLMLEASSKQGISCTVLR